MGRWIAAGAGVSYHDQMAQALRRIVAAVSFLLMGAFVYYRAGVSAPTAPTPETPEVTVSLSEEAVLPTPIALSLANTPAPEYSPTVLMPSSKLGVLWTSNGRAQSEGDPSFAEAFRSALTEGEPKPTPISVSLIPEGEIDGRYPTMPVNNQALMSGSKSLILVPQAPAPDSPIHVEAWTSKDSPDDPKLSQALKHAKSVTPVPPKGPKENR